MKQLDLFAAFAAAEAAAEKPMPKRVKALSPEEVRECWRMEQEFGFGSRLYHKAREMAKVQLREIEAGRVFVSPRYKKMLKSYF